MSRFTKLAALLLVLVAVLLGVLAYRIARTPAPAPTQKPVAQVSQAEKAPQQLYPVVVAARKIDAGATLSASMLETRQWPVTPSTAFSSDQAVLGKVVRVALAPGDPLTKDMLARGLATYLHEGERAVTVPVDESAGAAQQVTPGDMVDVFFTLNQNSEVTDTQTRLLLPRVRVLAYGDDSVDGPLSAPDKSGRRVASPHTAVLAVSLAQVNDLLLAVRRGKLKLVLRAPKDATMPDVALFPKREPVLQGRAGLTAEQKEQLAHPENLAYAGASLPQLAASKPKAEPGTAPAAAASGTGRHHRTVQVIRGGQSSEVSY